MNGKGLMSKTSECGSWNNLVDIDCTEAPKLKVHYTREVYDIKLISYGVTPVIDEHLLATKQSYTHASDSPYSIYIYILYGLSEVRVLSISTSYHCEIEQMKLKGPATMSSTYL